MQRLEVSGAVRPIYGSLGFKRLTKKLLTRNHSSIRQIPEDHNSHRPVQLLSNIKPELDPMLD